MKSRKKPEEIEDEKTTLTITVAKELMTFIESKHTDGSEPAEMLRRLRAALKKHDATKVWTKIED